MPGTRLLIARLWAALTLLLTVVRGDECDEWKRIQVPGVSPVSLIVSPKMPTHEQAINVSCTIDPAYRANLSPSQLYISKNVEYNVSHVNVEATENGIVLHVPHALHDDWRGGVHCNIYDIPTHICISFGIVGNMTAHIVFRRDPLPIVFEECVVDNWESLECHWSPSRKEQKNHTLTKQTKHDFTYSLIYHITGSDEQHTCSCPADPTAPTFCVLVDGVPYLDQRCVLDHQQFQMGQVYELMVRGETEHGLVEEWSWNDQYQQYFNTSNFVRPSPPTALSHSLSDTSFVLLSWGPPSTSWAPAAQWQLSYTVTINDKWNRNKTILRTSNTSVDFVTDPFTEYECSVTVIPVHQGYTSPPVSYTFSTPSTVPVMAPVVSTAGYEYQNDDTVQVYWQPIEPWEQGGADFEYLVTAVEAAPVPGDDSGTPGRRDNRDTLEENQTRHNVYRHLTVLGYTSSSVTLHVTMDTHVTITPRNTIGYGEPSKAIRVIKKPVAMTTEALLVEAHSDARVVTFTVNQADLKASYVIFWRNEESPEPVTWYVLDTPHSSPEVELSDKYTKYRFALARVSDGTNSGMDWNRAEVKLYDGLSDPVDVERVYHSASKHKVNLQWQAPDSRGHITLYRVHYCRCSDEKSGCLNNVPHGLPDTTRTVNGSAREVTLVGLEQGKTYCIVINSHTRAGPSPNSETVVVKTQPGVSPAIVAVIAVGAVIILMLSAMGVYKIYKKCHKVKKWYNTGYKVELPPEPQTADSASSDTPFLPHSLHSNKYRDSQHYHRALSSMSGASMDSGQFSLAAMDDGLSTDELTLSPNQMINSYTRTGYVASPTQLRSIPEDGDSGDVFDSDQPKFVQTYQVMPDLSSGGQVSTLDHSRGHVDSAQSRNGIGNYASVALQPGFSPEQAVVKFKNGVEAQPEDSGCQYTVIQVPSKAGGQRGHGRHSGTPKGSADYIRPEDIMDGTKGAVPKLRKPPVGGYVTNPALASTVHGHSGRNAKKPVIGYVPNDGTFSAHTSIPRILEPRPATVGNYVPNDGFFNPQTSIEPKTAACGGYVPNDGSFVPQNRTVENVGTNIATNNGYVANDGSFDPSCPQTDDKSIPQTISQEPSGNIASSKSEVDSSPYVTHEALRAAGKMSSTDEQSLPTNHDSQSLNPFAPDVSTETDLSVQSVPRSDPEAFPPPLRASMKDPLSKAKSLMALSDGRPLSRALGGAMHSHMPQARPQSLTMSSTTPAPGQPTTTGSFSELRPYRAHSGSMSDGSTARLGSTDTSGHGSGTHLEGTDPAGHCDDLVGYVSHDTVCPDTHSQQTNSTSDFEETCSTLSEESDILHNTTPTKLPQHAVSGYLPHPTSTSLGLSNDNCIVNSNAHDRPSSLDQTGQSSDTVPCQDNNNMVKDQLVNGCHGNHVGDQDSVQCVPNTYGDYHLNDCVTTAQHNDRQANGYVTLPV